MDDNRETKIKLLVYAVLSIITSCLAPFVYSAKGLFFLLLILVTIPMDAVLLFRSIKTIRGKKKAVPLICAVIFLAALSAKIIFIVLYSRTIGMMIDSGFI